MADPQQSLCLAIWQKAKENGYERGQYQELDKQIGLNAHNDRTIKRHETILDLYVTWRWGLQAEACKRSCEGLPDFNGYKTKVLYKGAPLPTLEEQKDFLRFYLKQTTGRLKDAEGNDLKHATVESVKSCAERFYRGLRTATGLSISPAETHEVYRWTKMVLPTEGDTADICRSKHNFQLQDLDRILTGLWSKKDLSYIHERNRIQFHFLFLVYCWSGARASTFFTKGLPYEDIIVVQRRRANSQDGYEFIWSISERWVKGNRDPINKTYAITGKDHSVLLYSDGALMLTMAIADGALFGITTLDDLWQQEIPEGDTEKIYRWHDSWRKIPIARAISKAGVVSASVPMTQGTFKKIFKDCLQRRGYVGDGLSGGLHQIRRQLGKRVDAHYTETERSQHILHSDPRIFGQSYVANTSSVAGKDVFLGEKPDNSVPEFFQGLALFREEGAPTSLSSRDMQDVLQSSELVEFDRYSNLEPKKKARKRQILLGRLQREALVSKQHRYIRERRDWKVLTKGKVREPCATDSNDPLQIIPERARLAEKMSSYSPLSSEESKEAMQDLHALLKQDFGVFYRPGEAPVKGACPFCHGSLEILGKRYRSGHIKQCSRQATATRLGCLKRELVYCYYCAQWFANDHGWNLHCAEHLPSIGNDCASFTYCNTLIRPAHCPFCLSDPRKESSQRLQVWIRDIDVIKHVKLHHDADFCGLCRLPIDPNDTLSHLADQHSLRQSLKHLPAQSMVDVKTSTYPSPENEYLADFDPIADTTLLNQDAWQETETVDDFLAQCISFPPSPDPTEVDGANDQSVQLSESDIITGSDHGQHSCDGGKEWQASLSNVSSTVAMTYPESSPEIPISGTADSVGFSPSTGCTTVNPSTLLVPHSKRGAPMLSSPLPKKRRIVLKPATRNNIFTASQSNDRAATDNKRHIPSTVNIEKPLVKRGAKNRIRIKIVGR